MGDTQGSWQPGPGHRVYVVAVEQHPPVVRLVETGDHADDGALAGAGATDHHRYPVTVAGQGTNRCGLVVAERRACDLGFDCDGVEHTNRRRLAGLQVTDKSSFHLEQRSARVQQLTIVACGPTRCVDRPTL